MWALRITNSKNSNCSIGPPDERTHLDPPVSTSGRVRAGRSRVTVASGEEQVGQLGPRPAVDHVGVGVLEPAHTRCRGPPRPPTRRRSWSETLLPRWSPTVGRAPGPSVAPHWPSGPAPPPCPRGRRAAKIHARPHRSRPHRQRIRSASGRRVDAGGVEPGGSRAVRESRKDRPAGVAGLPRHDELRQRQRPGLGARRGRGRAHRPGRGRGGHHLLRHRRHLLRRGQRGGHRAAAAQVSSAGTRWSSPPRCSCR